MECAGIPASTVAERGATGSSDFSKCSMERPEFEPGLFRKFLTIASPMSQRGFLHHSQELIRRKRNLRPVIPTATLDLYD
jgi:hypothetical protein